MHFVLLILSMDISSEEDEKTLTMIDPAYGDDASQVHVATEARPSVSAEVAPQDAAGATG